MMDKSKINELSKEKYRRICQVYNSTKNIVESLKRDDRDQIKILLRQRGEALELAKACNKKMEQLLDRDRSQEARQLTKLIRGDVSVVLSGADAIVEEIRETTKNTKALWQSSVEMDKEMSKRLMGKKSFYE